MASSLSSYERQRQANIAQNHAALVALGLADEPLIPTRIKSEPKARKRERAPQVEPIRKSGRLASISAPSVFVADERANGKVMLGGADAAATVAVVKSERIISTPDDMDDPNPNCEEALHPNERLVYALLREEKNSMANELNTAAYHIAQNRALMAMVRNTPKTTTELLHCWGWGEAKVGAHGERLLRTLQPHVHALEEAAQARLSHPVSTPIASATNAATVAESAAVHDVVTDVDVPVPESVDDLFLHERAAFDAMLAWKRGRAKELGFNDPCIICHNRTLCEIVRLLPADMRSLNRVWGIGAKRAAQHGALMLEALAPFRAGLLARRPKRPAAHTPPAAAAATAATAATAAKGPRRLAPRAGAWRDDAGIELASHHWRALELPSGDWSDRRQHCARVNGCKACGSYAARGDAFSYAVQSQKVLDALASTGAYGSHAGAHAAGWRWYARPNHGSNSHTHQWWPPQDVMDRVAEADGGVAEPLPMGTNKVLQWLANKGEQIFDEGVEAEPAD